jgi:LmbE family N-acetylglucosaminyl deacetylase
MMILIIAPHPDDEVLGCGGTIRKYVNLGNVVNVCIVTEAYTPDWSKSYINNRKREIEKCKQILGINKYFFLNFPTVKIDTFPQKDLITKLSEVVHEVNPDILFIPHKGDLNMDHRLIFEASLVASRPLNLKIKRILTYEVLSETEWGQAIEPFVPNVYIDISETIYQKKNAMEAYKSELKQYPHPRSLQIIEALAKKRGSEVGLNFAESFVMIREII